MARSSVGSHCPSAICVVAMMGVVPAAGAAVSPASAGALAGGVAVAQADNNNRPDAAPTACKNARRLTTLRAGVLDMNVPLLLFEWVCNTNGREIQDISTAVTTTVAISMATTLSSTMATTGS